MEPLRPCLLSQHVHVVQSIPLARRDHPFLCVPCSSREKQEPSVITLMQKEVQLSARSPVGAEFRQQPIPDDIL